MLAEGLGLIIAAALARALSPGSSMILRGVLHLRFFSLYYPELLGHGEKRWHNRVTTTFYSSGLVCFFGSGISLFLLVIHFPLSAIQCQPASLRSIVSAWGVLIRLSPSRFGARGWALLVMDTRIYVKWILALVYGILF